MTLLPQSSAVDPPSFGCVVYVRRDEQGQTIARVANLAGIQVVASGEPAALAKVVQTVKKHLQAERAAQRDIQWIDPPKPIEPEEQKRFLPLHL